MCRVAFDESVNRTREALSDHRTRYIKSHCPNPVLQLLLSLVIRVSDSVGYYILTQAWLSHPSGVLPGEVERMPSFPIWFSRPKRHRSRIYTELMSEQAGVRQMMDALPTCNQLTTRNLSSLGSQQLLLLWFLKHSPGLEIATTMSKLSPALKQLINAPFARPGALPAPQGIKAVYQNLARDAKERGVGQPAWVSMAVCSIPQALSKKFWQARSDEEHHRQQRP